MTLTNYVHCASIKLVELCMCAFCVCIVHKWLGLCEKRAISMPLLLLFLAFAIIATSSQYNTAMSARSRYLRILCDTNGPHVLKMSALTSRWSATFRSCALRMEVAVSMMANVGLIIAVLVKGSHTLSLQDSCGPRPAICTYTPYAPHKVGLSNF